MRFKFLLSTYVLWFLTSPTLGKNMYIHPLYSPHGLVHFYKITPHFSALHEIKLFDTSKELSDSLAEARGKHDYFVRNVLLSPLVV